MMRYASIDSKIRKANGDDSALQFTVRTGGQHKTMLIVQNDGVIVHVDKPLTLQTQGYKKTRCIWYQCNWKKRYSFPRSKWYCNG